MKKFWLAASLAIAMMPSYAKSFYKCKTNTGVVYQQTPCDAGDTVGDVVRQREAQRRDDADPLIVADKRAQDQSLIQLAKHAVSSYMKDPSSVQFRNVFVARNVPRSALGVGGDVNQKISAVCGEYNAKNSFGGYVGFRLFYWDPITGKAEVPEGTSRFVSYELLQLAESLRISEKCAMLTKYI